MDLPNVTATDDWYVTVSDENTILPLLSDMHVQAEWSDVTHS